MFLFELQIKNKKKRYPPTEVAVTEFFINGYIGTSTGVRMLDSDEVQADQHNYTPHLISGCLILKCLIFHN